MGVTLKRPQDLLGQRCKEYVRNLEPVSRQTDRAVRTSGGGDGANLGNRDVSLAQNDRLAFCKSVEIGREVGLRLMNIEFNHELYI